jgi:hypothetical protein
MHCRHTGTLHFLHSYLTCLTVLVMTSGCIIVFHFVCVMSSASCSHFNNLLLFQACWEIPDTFIWINVKKQGCIEDCCLLGCSTV